MSEKKVVACLEIGGTTASIAIANELGTFLWKKKGINTANPRDPHDSIKEICDELKTCGFKFDTLGIASFGPLNIQEGCIGSTPKPMWRQFPLVQEIQKHLGSSINIILETDVNAPAFSEYLAIKQKDPSVVSVAYLTIGTGVGLGLYADGHTFHGRMHPEFGHYLVRPYPGDTYEGICPFHKGCLEGLISANAIAARLGISPDQLPNVSLEDPIWDLFTYYVAQSAAAAAYAYSIDYFVIGGGIMTGENRRNLFDEIQKKCNNMINGYITPPKIVPPYYSKDAGLVGATACGLYSQNFNNSLNNLQN